MTNLEIKINQRALTAFSPVAHELNFDLKKNYLFDLSYLCGIQIGGERAQEFLQGQLSCDLREVTPQQMQQGALCDLKGRILALLDVINWEPHGFQLILPKDLMFPTQTTLAKIAPFSRATVQPSTNYTCFGFYLQNPDDKRPFDLSLPTKALEVISQSHYCCYRLRDDFYIFLIDNKIASTICEAFIKIDQWRGALAWQALQLTSKRINIYPESRGLFLPHRLELQLSGYLSFNKGCYKGQEIIARMHYRAKLKHELKIFKIKTDASLRSGQKILSENGLEEVGELIDYCPIGNNEFIIAASLIFEHQERVFFENKIILLEKLSTYQETR